MKQGNIFQLLPNNYLTKNGDEIIEKIIETENIKIEKISSKNYKSPEGLWYEQDQDEFVALLSGNASIEFIDGTKKQLTPGDYIIIPKHLKHRVEYTSSTEITHWLAFFYK